MSIDQGGAILQNSDTAPKKDEYKAWIKMSHEEMLAAQESGVLMGYHPDKGLGLVKYEEKKK